MDREAGVGARTDDLAPDTSKCDLGQPAAREETRYVVLEVVEIDQSPFEEVRARETRNGFTDLLEALTSPSGFDHHFLDALEGIVVGGL